MGTKPAPAAEYSRVATSNLHVNVPEAAHQGPDLEAGSGGITPRAKPLSLLPLIALIFFDVSGGPFGTEVRCRPGGPLNLLAFGPLHDGGSNLQLWVYMGSIPF